MTGVNVVAIGCHEIPDLLDAVGVRALREADVQVLPHAENVAAIDRGRGLDVTAACDRAEAPGRWIRFPAAVTQRRSAR